MSAGMRVDVSMPQYDVQTEWERPFSTGSPPKKEAAEPSAEDAAEFSDFNFWSTRPLPSPADESEESYNDAIYWKMPEPTLEQLEARSRRR